MSHLDQFLDESPIHTVRMESGGFTIEPRSHSVQDIDNFQPLAKAALNYSGTDYHVTPHETFGKYDSVFFERFRP